MVSLLTKYLSALVPERLYDRLNDRAAELGISRSALVRLLLERGLAETE